MGEGFNFIKLESMHTTEQQAKDEINAELARGMAERLNTMHNPAFSPTGRQAGKSASVRTPSGFNQPTFMNGTAIKAYSPEYYQSATTEWIRISPAEFEGLLYQRAIVRVPDFDQPHQGATLAVMVLDNHTKLAIQIHAAGHGGVQAIQSMTHSTRHLIGRLGLQSYEHPSGQVALDLYFDMSNGRHTIARTFTTIADWVLGFYKEDR